MAPRRMTMVAAAALGVATAFVVGGATTASDSPGDIASEAPAQTGVTSIEVAPSGNIKKDVGEPAGLTSVDGEVYFEIRVDDISVATTCSGRGVDAPPEHGYFVIIELSARVADYVGEAPPDVFMPLTADAFSLVGADGPLAVATSTDASWGCFEDDMLAAPFVGVGESTTGLVVLDSPLAAGTLVYAPGGGGWEWEF